MVRMSTGAKLILFLIQIPIPLQSPKGGKIEGKSGFWPTIPSQRFFLKYASIFFLGPFSSTTHLSWCIVLISVAERVIKWPKGTRKTQPERSKWQACTLVLSLSSLLTADGSHLMTDLENTWAESLFSLTQDSERLPEPRPSWWHVI